jgi:hypothetical protein
MLGTGGGLPASAQTALFDFDSGTPALTTGQGVPLDQTSGGVTAHVSAASGGFLVQDYKFTQLILSQFSGNYIYPNGTASVLVVQFSQPITNLSLDFATAEQTPIGLPTPVRLTAYTNSTSTPAVGSITTAGNYIGANTLPMGTLTFGSAVPFDTIAMNIEPGGATGFLVDNLTVWPVGSSQYTITTSASPAAGGTTSGDGSYPSGAPVAVVAVPNVGYAFVDWTENGFEVSTLPEYDSTADSERTLVANFMEAFTLTTSASPANGGTTTGDGTYNSGGSANIVASPNTGFAFVNWTVNGVPYSTWESDFFTLNSNTTVVANFAAACTITASSSTAAAGTVSGGGAYAVGAPIEVVAVPNTGYAFVSWTENGAVVSTTAPYSFTGSGDRTLVANFASAPLSVTFDFDTGTPALAANQTTPLDQTSGALTAQFSAPNAPAFSVQTDANMGWVMSKFSGNYLAGNFLAGELDIEFSEPITNIALSFATYDMQEILAPTPIELSAYATPDATTPVGTVTAQGTYTPGDGMPMGALAFGSATPFQVVQLILQSVPQGAQQFFVDNITVQPLGIMPCTMTTSAAPLGGGTTGGNGTYGSGASVTVTATANAGYVFVNWTEGGKVVSTAASYNFTPTANRSLVANFVQIFTVGTSSSPTAGGTTTGIGAYINGASVTVTATANPGYVFVNWTEAGTVVSTAASYNFTATANRSLVANFASTFTVATSASPPNGGSTSGDGTYALGATISLVAVPWTGYAFVNWTENGVAVSTAASYSFTGTTDRTVVGYFAPSPATVTFEFDTGTPALTDAQTTPFAQTSGGLTAYFSSTNDPAFWVQSDASSGWVLSRFSGNYLAASSDLVALDIQFSQSITNLSLTFATLDFEGVVPSTIELAAYVTPNSTHPVGTASAQGTYGLGDSMPMGQLAFSSPTPFEVVRISLPINPPGATSFIVDNITAGVSGPSSTITTEANPPEAGVTEGGGTYTNGASVMVMAWANPNYMFVNWTEVGTVISTSPSCSFIANTNRSLVANFVPGSTITTSVLPANGGLTSGDGTYTDGASVTVTATPGPGYAFVSWTEGRTVVSTLANYSFSASTDRSLVANFVLANWTIASSASPALGGTTSGGGTYTAGSVLAVVAKANSGYTFVNWTEAGTVVSTDPICYVTANTNRTLVANFVQTIINVATSVSPATGGTTSGNGTYTNGASVTLTATANPAYAFVDWTEAGTVVSTAASYTYTASADRTLVANFVQIFTVGTSSSPTAGGTTTGSGTCANGASVTVTATANPGYAFVNWTEGGTVVSTAISYNFTASGDRTLMANFIQTFTVGTSSFPATGGTTSGSGTYTNGASVTVTATANPGYAFVNWTEAGSVVSTAASYSFTANANHTLAANFVQTFTVGTSSSPAIGGATTGSGTYTNGANVTVTATPNPAYAFVDWTEAGTVVSTAASYNSTVSANRTLVANFVQTFIIGASASPTAGGTTTGSGTYTNGASVTVTATANAGYAFVNWTEASTVVSTTGSYSFSATANRTLVANFVQTFTIGASPLPATGGTTTGSGTYTNGASVTVTATANPGYSFVNWTVADTVVSTAATYTFTASADRALVASFAPNLQIGMTSSNMVLLSWPAQSPGYLLQESSALVPSGWADTTNNVNTIGGQNQVLETLWAGSRYFRLYHP